MKLRKLEWLLLLLSALSLFLLFGNSAALTAVLILILLPFLSIPWNLYLRSRMEPEVQTKGSVQKSGTAAVTLILTNKGKLPALLTGTEIVCSNQLNGDRNTFFLTSMVKGGAQRREQLELSEDYCGRIKIETKKILLYDCFGLIGIPAVQKAETYLVVQPETFAMDIALNQKLSADTDSDIYAQDRAGADLSETYQIREYVPGDSPRQIHWKLSGKFDRLIVREPSLPVVQDVLVFWERSGEPRDREKIDAQAETVISLCRNLLEASILFTVAWNDTEHDTIVSHEIRDMEELVGIIPRLLRAAGSGDSLSGAQLLLQTRPELLSAHMVYLSAGTSVEAEELSCFGWVTKLICTDGEVQDAIRFDPMQYREQLARLEI